jgi:ABC-type Fe3+/spermidine/putrescine transport system ATPase subunit
VTTKLKLAGVGHDYGKVSAVSDFSLDIEQGEFISLLGPSGCGKTTMLRMIAGFIVPTRGTIEMNGRLISSPAHSLPPEKRGMSMIFQSYAIWPNMTVAQNVAFGLQVRRVPAAEMKKRVQHMLEVVRLADYAQRYPAELSGGQQQRVALARAVVIQPEVLLLDEPLSNLDANLREEMRGEIRRMHDEYRITTVYVTHDQSEAMTTSNRIVVMNRGHIEQVDMPARLYEAPKTRFVASFIGKTNLLAARRQDGRVDFTAFSVAAEALSGALAEHGDITVSLRPQHVGLSAGMPDRQGANDVVLQCRVADAAYLGGYWEYVVEIGEGVMLSAISGEKTPLQRQQLVWLIIDPLNMAVITDA